MFCPAAAIIQQDGSAAVWTVSKDNRVQLVKITVGDSRDGRTEILEGLKGWRKSCSQPARRLKADQLVTETTVNRTQFRS